MTDLQAAAIIVGVVTGIVGALTGIGGLVLGIINFVAARRDKQRRVIVQLANGVLAQPPAFPPALIITAMNPGQMPVKLSEVGLLLPQGKVMYMTEPLSDVRYPHDLASGHRCQTWAYMHDTALYLQTQGICGKVELRGFYRDALGSTYTSKSLRFDVDRWAAVQQQSAYDHD